MAGRYGIYIEDIDTRGRPKLVEKLKDNKKVSRDEGTSKYEIPTIQVNNNLKIEKSQGGLF